MSGPAGIMALVLAEMAAGGAGFLFLTPLWKEVKRGFFYVTGAVVFALSLAAAASANAGSDGVSADAGRLAAVLALGLAGVTLVWLAAMKLRRQRGARAIGVASVVLATAMLFAFAHSADQAVGLSFFQLLTGAAFCGAVLDGLLLGHWYLTDRKLPRRPIDRMAWLLLGAVALEGAAVIVGALDSTPSRSAARSLNPLLTVAGSAAWIAIGMVACTGLIAVFIRLTLRGTRPTAVQSATGFFYLAVITAFTAEMAAKVGFLR